MYVFCKIISRVIKEYFKNNEWRKNNLNTAQKEDYRKKFDKMIIDYAKENKTRSFIYEGSELFCKSDIDLMVKQPIIIKRTGAILSYIRSFKRGNKQNNTFKKKIYYIKRMKWEFKRFYIVDLPKLNDFFVKLNKINNE